MPAGRRLGLALSAALSFLPGCREGGDKGGGAPGGDGDSGEDTGPVGGDARFSLLPDGQLNHLLPQYIGLDRDSRRLYFTSNASRTLAAVDVDAGELLGVYPLPDTAQPRTGLRVDATGLVWVSAGAEPALTRFDPATGEATAVDSGLVAIAGLARRPEGGVVALGATAVEGESAMVVIDPDGAMLTSVPVTHSTFGFSESGRGQVAVLEAQGSHLPSVLRLLDPDDLSEQGRVAAEDLVEHPGTFAPLVDLGLGRFAAVWGDTLLVIDGDTNTWTLRVEGTENKSAVPVEGGLLVFDRLSADPATAPLHGEQRAYDDDLNPIGEAVPTGKNTGYATLDPLTGLVWMNSEGSTEVLAMDPASGEIRVRVRSGEHLESVAVLAPAEGEAGGDAVVTDAVWFTGRLTNTVGRIDLQTGATTVTEALTWPVAPLLQGGALYVVTQMSNELVTLDPDTLAVRASVPLDLTLNGTLTFDDLAGDPARGSLFLSQTLDHVLVELDAATGIERGRWALSGAAPTDENKPGHDQLMAIGPRWLVLCTHSGEASLIDPDRALAEPLPVPEALRRSLSRAARFEHLSPVLSVGGGHFYIDGVAFNAGTFEPAPAYDVDADLLIGELDGQRLAYAGSDGGELRLLDEAGAVIARRALGLGADAAPTFTLQVSGGRPRLIVSDFETAAVSVLDLRDLTPGG